ncbi:MAG: DUF4013 domain-containing protein [Candidatus Woesearchaeota archaeon]
MEKNLSEKIKISFGMPLQDNTRMIIGIVLSAFPLINLLIYGYFIECANRILKKEFKLPDYNDFAKILKNAAFYLLIAIVYSIPAFTIIFIMFLKKLPFFGEFFAPFKAELYANSPFLLAEFMSNFLGFFLTAFVLIFITWYLIISSVINYSRNYDLREAFNLRNVLKVALNIKYFAFFLLTVLYSSALSFLSAFLLSWIPLIGNYLSSGVYLFISGVTQHALLAFVASEILACSEGTKHAENKQEIKKKGLKKKNLKTWLQF